MNPRPLYLYNLHIGSSIYLLFVKLLCYNKFEMYKKEYRIAKTYPCQSKSQNLIYIIITKSVGCRPYIQKKEIPAIK